MENHTISNPEMCKLMNEDKAEYYIKNGQIVIDYKGKLYGKEKAPEESEYSWNWTLLENLLK